MNSSSWEGNAMGYSTVETLLEEVSNHMAASNLSRYSRGLGGQKTGGSMRVVKPSSTSNSPRNSIGLGRRMTDGAYRRRLAMMDQNALGSGPFISNDGLHPPAQATRPVSWHPASHLPQMAPYQSAYPQSLSQTNDPFQLFDLPPTPAAYSGYTSPASTFSPVSVPFSGYDQQHYAPQNRPNSYNSNLSYEINQQPNLEQPTQAFSTPTPANMDTSMYSHFDWSNFAMNGFEDSTTAPPTPENFLPIQHPDPTFPAEDTIPYHPLDDSEEAGEELIGMGLYDNPEVSKSSASDPHLDNYRALMMSQLLGTTYRKPEPVGKGLKLEETWNPPASDDGDEEDDSEQDGEGEDEDESVPETTEAGGHQVDSIAVVRGDHGSSFVSLGNFPTGSMEPNIAMENYDRDGWL